jgi:hypothetical protein
MPPTHLTTLSVTPPALAADHTRLLLLHAQLCKVDAYLSTPLTPAADAKLTQAERLRARKAAKRVKPPPLSSAVQKTTPPTVQQKTAVRQCEFAATDSPRARVYAHARTLTHMPSYRSAADGVRRKCEICCK